jgi:hypothetical protein
VLKSVPGFEVWYRGRKFLYRDLKLQRLHICILCAEQEISQPYTKRFSREAGADFDWTEFPGLRIHSTIFLSGVSRACLDRHPLLQDQVGDDDGGGPGVGVFEKSYARFFYNHIQRLYCCM